MNAYGQYHGKRCVVMFDHGQRAEGVVDARTYQHMIEVDRDIIGVLLIESICESSPEKVEE